MIFDNVCVIDNPEVEVAEVRPTQGMTNEELLQSWQWCSRHGNSDDWTMLAMAYYSRGYIMNACAYFRKAEELKQATPSDKGVERQASLRDGVHSIEKS